MASYAKVLLSGGTSGKSIKVTSSGSSGATTIHTAISGSQDRDEIWLYAMNPSANHLGLTILYGGTTYPDDFIEVTVPPFAGPILVVPGWILNGANVVKAFGEEANKLTINGFVNRIYNSGS